MSEDNKMLIVFAVFMLLFWWLCSVTYLSENRMKNAHELDIAQIQLEREKLNE